MDVKIDQSRGDDEIARVDFVDFGLRIADCGEIGNSAIDNGKVGNFIALVCGIDDPAMADDRIHGVEIPPQR